MSHCQGDFSHRFKLYTLRLPYISFFYLAHSSNICTHIVYLLTHYLAKLHILSPFSSVWVFFVNIYFSLKYDLIGLKKKKKYITLNVLGQYLHLFIPHAMSVNLEVLNKYKNWSVGLVLQFGQHLVIWSDIQLKNSKKQWGRILWLCTGIFPSLFFGYWSGGGVWLVCGHPDFVWDRINFL